MFEVAIQYWNDECEKLLCESEPTYEVKGGCLFVDGGKGRRLVISMEKMFKLKVKHPLPEKVPPFTYSTTLNYDGKEEGVELLFSYTSVNVSILEDDGYPPLVVVKHGDDVVRIVNSEYLRSVKVNTYTEANK